MIVNAILHEHQIVVDIIAFVNKGDFPRSRLGEKQRGTVLAKWVKRSLQTEAQFAIRNSDFSPEGGVHAGLEEHRASLTGSLRGGVQGGSSLRNVESAGAGGDRFSMMPEPVGGEGYGGFEGQGERRPSIQQDYPGEHGGERPFSGESHPSIQQGYPVDHAGERPFSGESRPSIQPDYPLEHGEQGEGQRGLAYGREWEGQGEVEEDWQAEAVRHMNLAGDMGRAQ